MFPHTRRKFAFPESRVSHARIFLASPFRDAVLTINPHMKTNFPLRPLIACCAVVATCSVLSAVDAAVLLEATAHTGFTGAKTVTGTTGSVGASNSGSGPDGASSASSTASFGALSVTAANQRNKPSSGGGLAGGQAYSTDDFVITA